jgi:hypothetical protein
VFRDHRQTIYEARAASAGAGLGLAITFRLGTSLMYAIEPNKRTEATILFRPCQGVREFREQFRFVCLRSL